MGILPNPYVIIALIVFWIASISGAYYEGYHYEDLNYRAKLASQEEEASAVYTATLQRASDIEVKNANLNAQLEKTYADATAEATQKYLSNESLASQLGAVWTSRMQQRGCRANSSNSVPTSPKSSSVPAETASVPDVPTKAFSDLSELARDADAAAIYASTCRDWALNTQKTLNQPPVQNTVKSSSKDSDTPPQKSPVGGILDTVSGLSLIGHLNPF